MARNTAAGTFRTTVPEAVPSVVGVAMDGVSEVASWDTVGFTMAVEI